MGTCFVHHSSYICLTSLGFKTTENLKKTKSSDLNLALRGNLIFLKPRLDLTIVCFKSPRKVQVEVSIPLDSGSDEPFAFGLVNLPVRECDCVRMSIKTIAQSWFA